MSTLHELDEEEESYFSKTYNEIWRGIIQPKRSVFSIEMMGGNTRRINEEVTFVREDGEFKNPRGHDVQYTYFKYVNTSHSKPNKGRCLVYLHSHGGNRLEGIFLLQYAAHLEMNFCCFDFSGSGLSGGAYTTLGLLEHEDCAPLLNEVRNKFGNTRFVLWGRSMGAVAALMHASRCPEDLDYLILDSPFSDVDQMVRDVGSSYTRLGEYVSSFIFNLVKDEIFKRVLIDISRFRPIDYCGICNVPCIFLIGREDKLVLPERVSQMFEQYRSNHKSLMVIGGDHMSIRNSVDIQRVFNRLSDFYSCAPRRIGPREYRDEGTGLGFSTVEPQINAFYQPIKTSSVKKISVVNPKKSNSTRADEYQPSSKNDWDISKFGQTNKGAPILRNVESRDQKANAGNISDATHLKTLNMMNTIQKDLTNVGYKNTLRTSTVTEKNNSNWGRLPQPEGLVRTMPREFFNYKNGGLDLFSSQPPEDKTSNKVFHLVRPSMDFYKRNTAADSPILEPSPTGPMPRKPLIFSTLDPMGKSSPAWTPKQQSTEYNTETVQVFRGNGSMKSNKQFPDTSIVRSYVSQGSQDSPVEKNRTRIFSDDEIDIYNKPTSPQITNTQSQSRLQMFPQRTGTTSLYSSNVPNGNYRHPLQQ